MTTEHEGAAYVAGTDAGTECIKVVVLDGERNVVGRAVVPTRGYFQDCIQEAMSSALDDAQIRGSDLRAACVTGFAASCTPLPASSMTETACHARGAFHHLGRAVTLIDLGGRDPKVIHIDGSGRSVGSRSVRKCAVGIGTFLMFTARHLAVHPTRLMDLAATAEKPVSIGSYCSVFAEEEVIEQLRRGASVGEIALGAMYSVAERILEVEKLEEPIAVSGGVCELFPGVVDALRRLSGLHIDLTPEPILSGALGAALFAHDGSDA
jgi:predicted CoA-substrate-specific enzyme activase